MKLTRQFILLQITICLFFFASFTLCASVLNIKHHNAPKTTPDPPANPSDVVYKRILEYINSLAEEKMKSSNIMAKKKITGALPEGYPEETVQKALDTRNDKKRWRPVLGLPTELYKMCLFPFAKVNYVKWCNNNFFGAKNKGETCLYNFCEVCCDHLVFVYQNAAEKNLIGELLQLNQEQGIKAIKTIIDSTTIHNCKVECKRQYPVEMPKAEERPPRDPELGTEKKPAQTCADIKKWGPKSSKSGVYWIELPAKGPQKVFCDMETDKGGWTLFFNYLHQPGQELFLNENKLPNELKVNSHMYLENAGFSSRDVKEIRFICTERFKAQKKYWHFKTSNRDIISVAMTGDQSSIKAGSLANGYIDLRAPEALVGKYISAVQKNQVGQFDIFGKNPKGGFTSTTFGSSTYDANWTVKGDSPVQDIFECGSSHKAAGYSAPEESPNMVFTHHSIWFRGIPPSVEEARTRYLNSINKK